MCRTDRKIEILAPAGSIETLYATAAMGADAIYVGGPKFGARAYAKNPSVEELCEAIYRLHLMGKKLYLTVNTLIYDDEFEDLAIMLDPLVEAGLDAVIVQDLGAVSFITERYPELDIHASTQMAVLSADELSLLSKNVTRVVPARELTIDEIRLMRAATDLEIEVFVHGALCVCYSGWCGLSEHIGGRSGNRGVCAGPCRLKYSTKDGESYALNAKDSMTLAYIPELVDAGIDSFKIEGRMKSIEYASYMAYLYRQYTDIYLEEGKDRYRELVENPESSLNKDMKNAMDLYNRGGTFPSFLFAKQDEATIETEIRGHAGVPVGEVASVADWKNTNKSERIALKNTPDRNKKSTINKTAKIKINEDINSQDVLCIRRGSEIVYEFTFGLETDIQQKNNAKNTSSDIDKPNDKAKTITVNIGTSDVKAGDKVYRTRNNKLISDIYRMIEESSKNSKIALDVRFEANIGEKLSCTVSLSGEPLEITVTGDIVDKATKRPVSEEDIIDKLDSIADTPYYFDTIEIDIDDDAFFPIRNVKELRRRAISELEKTFKQITASKAVINKDIPYLLSDKSQEEMLNIQFEFKDKKWIKTESLEQLHSELSTSENKVLWIAFEDYTREELKKVIERIQVEKKNGNKSVYAFSLPRPLHGKTREIVDEILKDFPVKLFDAFIANSLVSITYRDRLWPDIPTYADSNLYMTNTYAKQAYANMNIQPLPSGVTRRTPLMTTRHKISPGEIITPKGDVFQVVNHDLYGYSSVFDTSSVSFADTFPYKGKA